MLFITIDQQPKSFEVVAAKGDKRFAPAQHWGVTRFEKLRERILRIAQNYRAILGRVGNQWTWVGGSVGLSMLLCWLRYIVITNGVATLILIAFLGILGKLYAWALSQVSMALIMPKCKGMNGTFCLNLRSAWYCPAWSRAARTRTSLLCPPKIWGYSSINFACKQRS